MSSLINREYSKIFCHKRRCEIRSVTAIESNPCREGRLCDKHQHWSWNDSDGTVWDLCCDCWNRCGKRHLVYHINSDSDDEVVATAVAPTAAAAAVVSPTKSGICRLEVGDIAEPEPVAVDPMTKAKEEARQRLEQVRLLQEQQKEAKRLRQLEKQKAEEAAQSAKQGEAIDVAVKYIEYITKGGAPYNANAPYPGAYKDPRVLAALKDLGIQVYPGEAREHMSGECTPRFRFRLIQ